MVRLIAIVANITLIATALFLWVAREGLPDSWVDWFIFSMMLAAPALSLSALLYSINHVDNDAGSRRRGGPLNGVDDQLSEISDDD